MRAFLVALLAVGLFGLSAPLSSQESKKFKLTEDEATILELTNAARKEQGAPPLTINETLTKCARKHSDNMAAQKKMAHELDGKTPFVRIKEAGYAFGRAAENVAYGDNPIPVKQIFEGWMKSEGHRKNILNPQLTEIGIGIGSNETQRYYTQVFGTPR